jgi:hypothetical protein
VFDIHSVEVRGSQAEPLLKVASGSVLNGGFSFGNRML